MPLRRIKQTSRTLLLEEFYTSENSLNLYTLLRNNDPEKQMDSFVTEIEKLEVDNFEDFVKKFTPNVWEWMEQTCDPACPVRFCYSLERPIGKPNAHEMKLSSNEFYLMVMDLYSKKGISGESNLKFDYSRVAELLSPRRVLENAKQLRADLVYNYNKMIELGEGAKTEVNECKKKIARIRKEIKEQYQDSFTGKIKLALADTESKLAQLPPPKKEDIEVIDNSSMKALPCKASFDENGDVQIIPIEDNSTEVVESNLSSQDNQLAIWVGSDFDNSEEEKNPYIRNLIVTNYAGGTSLLVQSERNELVEKRNQYTMIYKASQEQFIRAISSAVERMLDVKVFFEQATIQGRKLPAPLIVANCKANKLVEDDKVKERFEKYIAAMGKEPDDKRIWFAIIPAIGDVDFVDKVDLEIDLDNLDLDSIDSENTIKTEDGDILVSADAVKVALKILQAGKVTTFFNYRANEITGFSQLNVDILRKYREKLESINGNPYAVFCYPNFTILPKKETAIEIGKVGQDGFERTEYLDVPGVYVDSAYVAAGLMVASQNPDYLSKKGYKVNLNNPCVRFDLEDGFNRFIMLTNMNREGKVSWSSEIEDGIGKDKFGFCFCGNTKFYKDQRVNNTYVYVARNMCKDANGDYEPIYTHLTMDFVMQYLQTENTSVGGTNKFKSSVINKFINETVGAWKREAESDVKANSILHEKEDIKFEESILKMKFNNSETEITLEIEKE